jgi:hypothetical protein
MQRVDKRAYARATGRLVRNPKAIVLVPVIVAVAVVGSLLIPGVISLSPVLSGINQDRPIKHVLYADLSHKLDRQRWYIYTHLPPLCVRIDAFRLASKLSLRMEKQTLTAMI